jgi:hypothetical protein
VSLLLLADAAAGPLMLREAQYGGQRYAAERYSRYGDPRGYGRSRRRYPPRDQAQADAFSLSWIRGSEGERRPLQGALSDYIGGDLL